MDGAPVRADVALVERGLARSRALARRLIDAGAVDLVADRPVPVTRASQPVRADQALAVRPSSESRFVSRGGAKLDAALQRLRIDCRDRVALDVGMSTGGFTDCLLSRGAARVIGIEVGHGQLDPVLAADPRVTCLEKTHVRQVDAARLRAAGAPANGFDLIVVDLSFISALTVLDRLAGFAADGSRLVALVKPQFELGPRARDGRGIVRPDADLTALQAQARETARAAGWTVDDWFACELAGGDGNQEYFLAGTRHGPRMAAPAPDSPTPE